MKVFVKGLNSCINRKRDVARYKRYIRDNGHELVESAEEADVTPLWTCAFRQDHHDNSLAKIRELKRGGGELVVCGCLPDIDPAGLKKEFSGKIFKWRDEKAAMPALFGQGNVSFNAYDSVLGERSITGDPEETKVQNPDRKVVYTDQFVKLFVSEGCRHKCTYCAEIIITGYKPKYVLLSGYMESHGMPSARIKGKVPPEEIRRRVHVAQSEIQAAGVICNYDNSSLSQERFSKDFLELE